MNWSISYANDTGTPDGDTGAPDDGLSTMATDLNSHIFSYTGQSGQSPTDRMYKGNKGADLDNQPLFANLLSKYNKSSTGAIGKAVQQIRLFTGKDSYGSDIRTNREKFPEFHKLMDHASPIAGGLSRGTVLTDVRHGTPGSPIDISQHYKVGDKMTTQVTSATSDPNLAQSWVLDDKQRFDKAKDTGDNSVLDTKYNGARHAAFVVQHFPAGIKGLQVAPLSAVPEHNEVVPQAGQKLIVSNITGPDESGVHHVYYKHDTERTASWSQRYATTRKSIRELQSILPEGWEHVGFTQPDGNRPVKEFKKWMPPQQTADVDMSWVTGRGMEKNMPLEPSPHARRNRIKTPDVHMVMNPATGNTAEIYDHSGMNADARQAYWNPIDHGSTITEGLKRMDRLTRNTNLRMIRHDDHSGNILAYPSACAAPDGKNVNLGVPDTEMLGKNMELLDHELGHIRHDRDPRSLINFARIITDYHNANSKPREQVNPGWVEKHVRQCNSNLNDGHVGLYSKDVVSWGRMPEFLNKVVKSTATDDYGASSLTESYAQHHNNYLNGSKDPLTQRLGRELGWDHPIQ